MSLQNSSPNPAIPSYPKVKLVVRGYPVPAFKNAKRVVGKKLVTERKIKALMEKLSTDLEWQLLCAFQTIAAEMPMGQSPRSLMHSLTPADDCWTQIPELNIKVELVKKGEEGAEIIIERID